MKVVCIADIHLHPYRECSRDNGADRLADGLSAVRQSLEFARARQARWVMLGDLKHLSGMWHQGALNGMLNLFDEFPDVNKWMIPGNHDGIASGASGLAPFRKYGTVELFEEPTVLPSGIAFWPWQPNFDQLSKFVARARKVGVHMLFAHAFLSGSRVGPHELRLEGTGATLDQFGLGKKDRPFKWAFFGDVHKAQPIASKCYYVGSPLALNWGEREDDKGIMFVDTTRNVVERRLVEAPRFHQVEWKEGKPVAFIKGDFVRLIVDETVKARDIERVREASRARYFQVVIRRQSRAEQRTKIHAGMNQEQLLKEYMTARPIDKLDNRRVFEVGLSLLKP